jgi:hypothetical protein
MEGSMKTITNLLAAASLVALGGCATVMKPARRGVHG